MFGRKDSCTKPDQTVNRSQILHILILLRGNVKTMSNEKSNKQMNDGQRNMVDCMVLPFFPVSNAVIPTTRGGSRAHQDLAIRLGRQDGPVLRCFLRGKVSLQEYTIFVKLCEMLTLP